MTLPRHCRNLCVVSADGLSNVPATRPRAQAALAPAARAGPRLAEASQRVALVVDDERMVGEVMAMFLRSQGWRTVVTAAPEDAAALARNLVLNLLVTDLRMPGMSGLDLASSLREQRATLPVLLTSGWADAATLELAQPFVFLPKPFGLDALLKAIASLFADHSAPVLPAGPA